MRTLAAVALVLALAAPALCVDTVAIDGFDYWLYGYTHIAAAAVDTIDPGFTPDRWIGWVKAAAPNPLPCSLSKRYGTSVIGGGVQHPAQSGPPLSEVEN